MINLYNLSFVCTKRYVIFNIDIKFLPMSTFKTRKEIALEFGISVKTLNKYLIGAGIQLRQRELISPTTYREIKQKIFDRS